MMTVIDVTSPPTVIKGYLQRYLLEIRAGLFVGNLPKGVQESLWGSIVKHMRFGSAILVTTARNEAGYTIFTHGKDRRIPRENYGVWLVSYLKNYSRFDGK